LQSIPMLCALGKAAQSYEALHLAACTGQEDTARGHCQYTATNSHIAEAGKRILVVSAYSRPS